MININIITAYEQPIFIHQLDKERYSGKINFAENSHEDIVWDYIVVFQNLSHDFDGIRYRRGGLIFIAGEPECAEPYCDAFFDQFDCAIVPHPHRNHPKLVHTNPALNWHFGRSYAQSTFKYDFIALQQMDVPLKEKAISMMCSNKTMMPGHVMRYKFFQMLQKEYRELIDFFGSGIMLVDDKADILLPYMFHICIENSQDEHYWTEKIADPILGFSVPIYCGCPNIGDYFPKDAIISIDINKPEEAKHILSKILQDPAAEYQKRLPALTEARNQLLDRHNVFPTLERMIMDYPVSESEICSFNVRSYMEMPSWKTRFYISRFKRLVFKLTH